MHLKTEGLILRVVRFREADRFLRLLVPSGEVLEVLARGVGRSVKRFSGGLEPLSLQLFELSRRRATWVAEQAQHLDDHLELRRELPRFYLASYAAERTLGAAPCAGLFQLLGSFLGCLAVTPPDLLAMRMAFDLKLLDLSGVAPELEECVDCGAKLGAGRATLEPGGGGFRCPAHADRDAAAFDAGVRALLATLLQLDLPHLGRLTLSPAQRAGAERCVGHFLASHLPGPIRSEKLLGDCLRSGGR
jgi:DNA repair protein RecO (recombination protein O)